MATGEPMPPSDGPRATRTGRTWLIVAAAYAVLLAALFHELWLAGAHGRRGFGADCLREYWPDLVFQVRSLRAGHAPLWNPYALGGYPFDGDPQAGTWSPVNWVVWLASLLSGSTGSWMIQVKVLLTLWAALVGMHVLAWRRTGSHAAGAVAAVAWVLGSPFLVHKAGAFLWPFAFLPWAVLALERFTETPSLARGAALAATIWLCGAAGHPQGFFYDLIVLAVYWLFRVVATGLDLPRTLRAQAPGLALCAALTALLLAPVYLPAAAAVAASPRAIRGFAYATDNGLSGHQLRELIVPNLDTDWQADVYVGLLTLVAAAFAVFAARDDRKRAERQLWAGLGAIALLCAAGTNTKFLPFLVRHVPGFGLFRIAYRYKLIFGFAVALLAGDGVGELATGKHARALRGIFAGLAAIALVAVGAAAAGMFTVEPGAPARGLSLAFAAGSLGLAALAALLPVRARLFAGGAAALLVLDLWAAGAGKLDILEPPPQAAPDRAVLAGLGGTDAAVRFVNHDLLPYYASTVYAARELTGFPNPIQPRRQEELMAFAAHAPQVLARFGVRWWVGYVPPSGIDLRLGGPGTWELLDPTPLVRVYGAAERLPAAQTLARLASPGPIDVALVDPADAPPASLPDHPGPPEDGRVTRYEPDRIEADVTSAAGGIAVLAETWAPGWRATVNGADAPLFRANYLLRAVVVPAGTSHVVWRYAPRSHTPLFLGFLLALGVLGGMALRLRRILT